MFNLLSSGMATSARHVVGLHDPPKNTSGAGGPSDGFSSDFDVVAAVSVDEDVASDSKRSSCDGTIVADGP